MRYALAADVKEKFREIVKRLGQNHIDLDRVVCVRSYGSRSKAIARIWGLPKIFQVALDCRAYYIIEVISERYDRLTDEEKDKVLIHELMHIPKKFSGGLVPHNSFGRKIDRKTVEKLYNIFKSSKVY